MNIKSAQFIKSVVGSDDVFEDGIPQTVFMGRSNVGKSSVINALANQKNLAKTSSFPGRTQQINIFFINKAFYLVDLPGYGYAKVPQDIWLNIQKMINWFLFDSGYDFKKVILIIDAKVGPSAEDMDMLYKLERGGKDIVVIANKIDKLNKTESEKQMQKIQEAFGGHKVIPFSAQKRIGLGELVIELLE